MTNLDASVEFLLALLNIASPTGYTEEAIQFTRSTFTDLKLPGLSMRTTPKGGLVLMLEGRSSEARRGLTAHVDTLGLMVREIKSNGRIKTQPLGGIIWGGIETEGITLRTHDDRRYRGTVLPVNPSVHVNRNIHNQERSTEMMEIRLDARTNSAAETRALGIEVGDFIFLDPRVEEAENGFIRSRFLDNKAGVACIFGALLALKEMGRQVAQDTAVLISNYEEVGHGAAGGWPYDLDELLTIDMGALGDGQNGDEFSVSICTKDSGGPYHVAMVDKLRQLAKENDIPYKTDIYPFYNSDGTAYWRSGGVARVGLIGPGVDASHSYERTHRESLLATIELIRHYLVSE